MFPFVVEAAFGFERCGFFEGVQASVAEPVFSLEEGFGAEASEYGAWDEAVLVVSEDYCDGVGRVHQLLGFFAVEGCGCFGRVPQAFAVFTCLVQGRVVTGAGGVVACFLDGGAQPLDVASNVLWNHLARCFPAAFCQSRASQEGLQPKKGGEF